MYNVVKIHGYVKSKTSKNAWEIDEEAAVTIRRIYALALEGQSYIEIATILNAEDIPTPLKHRKNNGTISHVINTSVKGMSVWRKENVSRVLRDERYTGKIISGKMKKQDYGTVKRKLVPKSDWLVVTDAHEPIITQEDFDKVQALLGPYHARTVTRENSNVFAGKLFCGHCGHGLRRYERHKSRPNSKYKPRYVCRFSLELGLERCLPEPVMESYISEVVLEALRVEIELAQSSKSQADKQNTLLLKESDKLNSKTKKLTLEVERSKNEREQLFENFADGKLTKEQYVQTKTELTERITATEAEIERINLTLLNNIQHGKENTVCGIISPYANVKSVTSEVASLIKRINVFADNRFEIVWGFNR